MNTSDPKAPPKPAAAPYGRFIPREELGEFAAWRPGALGGGSAAPDDGDAAQRARQAGYQDGYRDGLAALDSFKQSFARAQQQRVDALLAAFDADLLALERALATAVADCAVQLARQVVRSELATRPELVAQVAHEALATLLPSARQLRLHVHPDDQPLVADGAGEALAARGGRLVVDGSIARGGCRIEADIGTVDAQVETRWQRAVALLGVTGAAPIPSEA